MGALSVSIFSSLTGARISADGIWNLASSSWVREDARMTDWFRPYLVNLFRPAIAAMFLRPSPGMPAYLDSSTIA